MPNELQQPSNVAELRSLPHERPRDFQQQRPFLVTQPLVGCPYFLHTRFYGIRLGVEHVLLAGQEPVGVDAGIQHQVGDEVGAGHSQILFANYT